MKTTLLLLIASFILVSAETVQKAVKTEKDGIQRAKEAKTRIYVRETENDVSVSKSEAKAQMAQKANKKKSQIEILSDFRLLSNYPNPFNPSTVISYQLPENSYVTLKVFDMIGNEVATLINEEKPAGYHTVTFEAGKLASGVYIYQLTAGGFSVTKKLILTK